MSNWIYAALGGLTVWLLKEIYGIYKDSQKINTEDIKELGIEIHDLKVEMRLTRQAMEDIPKLKRDVDALHQKFREHGQAQSQPPHQ
jgi:GDP-D-mannose dehydratase